MLKDKKLVVFYSDRYESLKSAEIADKDKKFPTEQRIDHLIFNRYEFQNLENKNTKNSIIVALDFLESLDLVEDAKELLNKNDYTGFVKFLNDERVDNE